MRSILLRPQTKYDESEVVPVHYTEIAELKKKARIVTPEVCETGRQRRTSSSSRSGSGAGGRSRPRRRRVVALPRGLLQCTGGGRSRSATPERHSGRRVCSPTNTEHEAAMLAAVRRKLKGLYEKERKPAKETPPPIPKDEVKPDPNPAHMSAPNLNYDENPPPGSYVSRASLTNMLYQRRSNTTPRAGHKQEAPVYDLKDHPRSEQGSTHCIQNNESQPYALRDSSNYTRHGVGAVAAQDSRQYNSTPDGLAADSLASAYGRSQTYTDSHSRISWNNLYASVRHRRKSEQSNSSAGGLSSRSMQNIQSRPLPPIPQPSPVPPRESELKLVRTLDLKAIMRNKWISGLAVTRKGDIAVVDLRDCHILDYEGQLKRSIGLKGSVRLKEPIDVTVLSGGHLAISDHADREVKIYSLKGTFVRRVRGPGLVNIAGVAANDQREVFIAGTDSQHVGIHSEDGQALGCIPNRQAATKGPFDHPYSVAVNPLSGALIVGDDYRQRVVAVSRDGKVLWRFCPTGDRLFFPSSICVDAEGYVFVADLYNEKVYMLDSGGKYLKTLLARGQGLRGAPSAIAVDGRGHLIVADDEKTIKIFQYGSDGFALYRRYSKGPDVMSRGPR